MHLSQPYRGFVSVCALLKVAYVVLQMDDRGTSGVDERFLTHQASQKFGADLQAQQKGKLRSGDDDLSAKMPLSQRRAKYDSVKAKQSARLVFASLRSSLSATLY